jgi:hypothetical protein
MERAMVKSYKFPVGVFLILFATSLAAQRGGPVNPDQCGPIWWHSKLRQDIYAEYSNLASRRDAAWKECRANYASTSPAHHHCFNTVKNKSDVIKSDLENKEKQGQIQYERDRDRCLVVARQNQENYERQQAYNRHAQQAQQQAQQQAEQQRVDQFNKESGRSNAEREAYNRAAQERTERQQLDYQRQAAAARQSTEAKAQQTRPAEIAAAVRRTDEQLGISDKRIEDFLKSPAASDYLNKMQAIMWYAQTRLSIIERYCSICPDRQFQINDANSMFVEAKNNCLKKQGASDSCRPVAP